MLDFSIFAPFAISLPLVTTPVCSGQDSSPSCMGTDGTGSQKVCAKWDASPGQEFTPLATWTAVRSTAGWAGSKAMLGSWPATDFIRPLSGMDQPQGPQSPGITSGMAVPEEVRLGIWERLFTRGWSGTDTGSPGQWARPQPIRVQGVFAQRLHIRFEFWVVLCRAWTGVGLNDLCRPLPIQYILWFYDPQACTCFILLVA